MKLHVLLVLVYSCQAAVILQARNPDDIGGAIAFNNQDTSGRYDFGYSEAHPSGATFRKESGDVYGNKYGSYGLRDADGRLRIVNYVADENGFRADVRTNEPGVAPQDPASITIRSAGLQAPPPPAVIAVPDPPPPPPPKGVPFRYAAAVVQDVPPPKGLPFRYSAPVVRDIPIKGYPVPPPAYPVPPPAYPVPPPAYRYPDTFGAVVGPVPFANPQPKGYPVPSVPYNAIQGKGYVSSFRNFAPTLPVALAPPQFPYYGGLKSLPNYQSLGYYL